MIPTSFPESNGFCDTPIGVSPDEVCPLATHIAPVFFTDGTESTAIISCWKFTKEELEEVNKTGRVWLWIIGSQMPPVSLDVESPFKPV
jgi:hypothetical protein